MKNFILLVMVIIIVAAFSSCVKSGATTSSNTLIGKWNLVSDTLVSGVGASVTPKYYTGITGDYFDFRTDNKLYIKEGTVLDTLVYSALTANTVVIQSFGITVNGVPQTTNYQVSSNSAVLTTPVLVNPGAYYRRAVHLSQ